MRIYDPRLGRFLSVDPIASHYPELPPYQFASNRPIDLDSLEYKSAADWAQKNISDYTIQFNRDYNSPSAFKSLRKANWKDVIGKTMYCATGTSLAYAQGNPLVAAELQKGKFESPRYHQMEYFQRGSKYASLIESKDYANAERSDLIFLQNPDKKDAGSGHIAILASSTRDKSNGGGKFTVNAYSTNAGSSYDPARQGTHGEVIYLFDKNKDGETQLMAKWWYDVDNKTFRYRDMREENLILQGLGRIDENKLNKD